MRDFLVKPQYDYAIEGHVFHSALLGRGDDNTDANSTLSRTTAASTDVSSLGSLRSQVPRVLIVYGSETGTAEGVARELKKKLKILAPRMCTLDEAAGLSVVARRRVSHVLCVCSTFGVGGCPSSAAKFFNTPIVEGLPSTTKFAVLALGSTLYPEFCQAGITVDQMLRDAGFEQIIRITTADEVEGGATKASEWVDLVKRMVLPPYLEADLIPETDEWGVGSIVNSLNWYHGLEMQPTEQTGTRALCVENEALTANVVKITFAVPESSSYVSGDHLVVQPVNSPGVVLKFLECFSTELASAMGLALAAQSKQSFVLETFEGDFSVPADVFFSMPTTLESILTKHIDLAMRDTVAFNLMDLMKQRLIEVWVSLTEESDTERVTNNELVKEFLSLYESLRQDKANVNHLIAQFPTLIAFFDHFRPLFLDKFVEGILCRVGAEPLLSLADVLAVASRLQSRYYSISSSDRVSPEKITITVGVLETTTSKGAPITGVCSHYLASLKPGVDQAVVGISKSSFRLPETKEAPLIMVGAGTGISPMMGFLQDRALDAANGEVCGPIHLFFGCRDESSFMYEEVIRGYEASGLLTLHLAFSRSKSVPKAYVQHKLVEMGQACCDLLLDPDTHYYVCGDARMANDCHENCVRILRRFAVMSRVAAVHHLKKMRMAGRWLTDVWGIVCK
jgi:sulfite reductase alpha subunit-like flavoprotein